MKVSEAMTQDVRVASPEETVQKAARTMASLDSGVLPVGENDHLIGMITDRDIAIRGIAQGKGPKAKVRDVMTEDVKYCFDDQDVEEVTRNMADIQCDACRCSIAKSVWSAFSRSATSPAGTARTLVKRCAGFRGRAESTPRRADIARHPCWISPVLGIGIGWSMFRSPGAGCAIGT